MSSGSCGACGSNIVQADNFCPHCGAQISSQQEPSEPSVPPVEKDWANRTFEGGTKGLIGCLALVAFIIAVPTLLVVLWVNGTQSPPAPAATTEQALQSAEPDETEIVSECDMTVRESLTSGSSYDPEFHWKYTLTGDQAEVMRKFEATNGFNAKITSGYTCRYDWRRRRITFLQIVGPYGSQALIGRR